MYELGGRCAAASPDDTKVTAQSGIFGRSQEIARVAEVGQEIRTPVFPFFYLSFYLLHNCHRHGRLAREIFWFR